MHPLTVPALLIAVAAAATAATEIPTNTWVMAPTHGFPVQIVGFDRLVYAPAPVKKAVILGNYHELGSEPNEALIAYDLEANRWDVLDMGSLVHGEHMPEGGHGTGAFAYDPHLRQFLYWGTQSGSNQAENNYHTWWFDPIGQVGRHKQTPFGPGAHKAVVSYYDVGRRRWVFLADGTFAYDPVANAWTDLRPSGTPPTRGYFSAMTYRDRDGRGYHFGGAGATDASNDLHVFDLAANAWSRLEPTGSRPEPRSRTSLAYDSRNDVLLVYGGMRADGTMLGDTWIFSPTANRWTEMRPARTPTVDGISPSWERVAYDPDHNVFIFANAAPGGFAAGGGYLQTWLYRYAGDGPDSGTTDPVNVPTPGRAGHHADAWASEPVLTAWDGDAVLGWIETGRPADATEGRWPHLYAARRSGGAWAQLGGRFDSIAGEARGRTENRAPSIAMVAGEPWVSWLQYNNSGAETFNVYARRWNGAAWVGGRIPKSTDSPFILQGRSQLADVGGVATAAVAEIDKSRSPMQVLLRAWSFVGGSWRRLGDGPLNRDAARFAATPASLVASLSLADHAGAPLAAWTEFTRDAVIARSTPPQVYVARWADGAWTALGGSLNADPAGWATDACAAVLRGVPHVAWTERSVAGEARLRVKAWDGAAWRAVGATLNRTAGQAFRARLVADDATGALHVAWVEQAALGERAQAYVSRWSGGAWTPLGGSLNADGARGSAQRMALTIGGGQPIAAWGEVAPGCLRQLYAKRWDGSAWTMLPGSSARDTTPPSAPMALAATAVSAASVELAWAAATDDVAVVGYRVLRDGAVVGTTARTSWSDASVASSTGYAYAVQALDASGNASAATPPLAVTTPADGGAPGGPGTPGGGPSTRRDGGGGCGAGAAAALAAAALALASLRRRFR
ncbi:MAG TPA: kelch repeat-containing protein [Planctomycetota bacterium]|nr:kelch repeat-containing protein [Planctomycetota bacterium]